MSANPCWSIYCDSCRVQSEDSEDTEGQAREDAEARGWQYVRVQNGSMWDLCPECVGRVDKMKEKNER